MSIASEISRLQTAKSDIAKMIVSKGVTVPSGTKLDGFPSLINQISGGSGGWKLLGSTKIDVTTTSTTAASAGYVDCGTQAYDHNKIIYVRVRDQNGPNPGKFWGSDTFFVNYDDANSETNTLTLAGRIIHRVSTAGKYQAYTTAYGVYGHSLTSAGRVNIYRRYNATYSLTIDSTYTVDVYSIDFPDGVKPFPVVGTV